ncbi:hypothetical protein BDDG_13050 [Blastomyces dermatitidis ATCC 18188]|uniref:WW domain-containing protein n=1 Tax=Ajellomyces dermatitidis (strain ATCC 18188 / CBS 674.68) TaxID=653446 RepID=A0A0J9ER87_AJEDA|nr:hypothetical protein BDDG_13050 [Blastomyces dermatitidis ATCC 18188]
MHPPRSSHFFLLLLSLLTYATASILTITIPPSNLLPNPNSLPASTHATLTTLRSYPSSPSSSSASGTSTPAGLRLKAPLSRKSNFVFNIPSGQVQGSQSFLLDIHSRDYIFAPYRVDVDADGGVVGVWETYRGNAWENRGVEKGMVQVGEVAVVEARVMGTREFYEERAGFSPLSLFKNPMILLVVFALAVTVGMPYLMDMMDPETRAEFERHSRKGRTAAIGDINAKAGAGAGANAIRGAGPGAGAGAGAGGFDLAGWMAGTSQGPMAALDSTVKAAASGREGGSAARRSYPSDLLEHRSLSMSFASPSTPPPPPVPDGWKTQFDDRYKEWFYINLKTGVSQWEPPPLPDTLPPSYDEAATATPIDPTSATTVAEAATDVVKKTATASPSASTPLKLGSNNPYNPARQRNSSGPETHTSIDDKMIAEDAKLATKLQAEEDERAWQGRDQGQQTYAGSPQPQSQTLSPPSHETKKSRSRSGSGFLGKLISKASSKVHHGTSSGTGSGFASPDHHQQPYQQQQQQQQQYQRPYSAPYGYSGYPAGGAGLYGPQQPYMYGQRPRQRRGMGGIGPGGAAALGLGGGLLGGAMLANAIGDHHDYQEGYADGVAADDFGGGDFWRGRLRRRGRLWGRGFLTSGLGGLEGFCLVGLLMFGVLGIGGSSLGNRLASRFFVSCTVYVRVA